MELLFLTFTDFIRVILTCSFIGIIACTIMRKVITESRLHPTTNNVSMIAFLVAVLGSTLAFVLIIDEIESGTASGGLLTSLSVLSAILGFVTGVAAFAWQFFRKDD